jgi:hypothetical protein
MGIYNMNYENLNKLAANQGADPRQEQETIDLFNSTDAKEAIKKLSYGRYISLQATYFKTHYRKFTAAAVGLTLATAYIAALAGAPVFFPFSLAALTGYTMYAAAAAALAVAAYTGYVVLPRFMSGANKLKDRFDETVLSSYDVALLGMIAVTGVAFIGALHFMPALLPIIGSYAATMSTTAKLVADTAVAVPTALAMYAMFKGRPAAKVDDDTDELGLEGGRKPGAQHEH